MGGFFQPIFFAWSVFPAGRKCEAPGLDQRADSGILDQTNSDIGIPAGAKRIDWRGTIEQTVSGLGYDLVDVERSAGGLLRVFIDRIPGRAHPGGAEFVTVDDCEAVTRQLQYVLEVDGVAYERLEVSSPGLDRPLKREADFARFAGHEVSVTLKLPFQGRKVFRGVLHKAEAQAETAAEMGEGLSLVFNDGKADQVLAFTLDEVREARLVPVVDFKGRRGRKTDAARQEVDGGQDR